MFGLVFANARLESFCDCARPRWRERNLTTLVTTASLTRWTHCRGQVDRVREQCICIILVHVPVLRCGSFCVLFRLPPDLPTRFLSTRWFLLLPNWLRLRGGLASSSQPFPNGVNVLVEPKLHNLNYEDFALFVTPSAFPDATLNGWRLKGPFTGKHQDRGSVWGCLDAIT